MIVGPIQAQMDDFCDLHGTPDTPVSRIVTVNVLSLHSTYYIYLEVLLLEVLHGKM